MTQKVKLTAVIDEKNHRFTSNFKGQLANLDGKSDRALEWLMLEHFQFSAANPGFLSAAATTAEQLDQEGVAIELRRNFNEEDGHAAIYRKGLSEIGTDVDTRVEFEATTGFLQKIRLLTTAGPSYALGAMYATETAAIFEHEVFWEISRKVCRRREIKWESTIIKGFHDMHLEGVEQSHKDELGVFLDPAEGSVSRGRKGMPIAEAELLSGAEQAIDAMTVWWEALLGHAKAI